MLQGGWPWSILLGYSLPLGKGGCILMGLSWCVLLASTSVWAVGTVREKPHHCTVNSQNSSPCPDSQGNGSSYPQESCWSNKSHCHQLSHSVNSTVFASCITCTIKSQQKVLSSCFDFENSQESAGYPLRKSPFSKGDRAHHVLSTLLTMPSHFPPAAGLTYLFVTTPF